MNHLQLKKGDLDLDIPSEGIDLEKLVEEIERTLLVKALIRPMALRRKPRNSWESIFVPCVTDLRNTASIRKWIPEVQRGIPFETVFRDRQRKAKKDGPSVGAGRREGERTEGPPPGPPSPLFSVLNLPGWPSGRRGQSGLDRGFPSPFSPVV